MSFIRIMTDALPLTDLLKKRKLSFGDEQPPSPKRKKLTLEEREEKERKKEEEKVKRELEKQKKIQEKEEEKRKKEQERQKLKEQKEEEKLKKLQEKEEEKRKKEEERIKLKEQKEEERLRLKEEEKQKKLREKEEEKLKKLQEKEEEKLRKIEQKELEKKQKELEKEKEEKKKLNFWLQRGVKIQESPVKLKSNTSEHSLHSEESEVIVAKQKINCLFTNIKIEEELKKNWEMEELEKLFKQEILHLKRTNKNNKNFQIKQTTAQKTYPHLSCYKYFRFAEDKRPAFYGTYSKTSTKISARNPLGKDQELFDYEVDSDDEWESEGSGEDIDEEDLSDGDVQDDENIFDDFCVPDGYLSEEEGLTNDKDGSISINRGPTNNKVVKIGIVYDLNAASSSEKELLSEFTVEVLRPVPTTIQTADPQTPSKAKRASIKGIVPEELTNDLLELISTRSMDSIPKIVSALKLQ